MEILSELFDQLNKMARLKRKPQSEKLFKKVNNPGQRHEGLKEFDSLENKENGCEKYSIYYS